MGQDWSSKHLYPDLVTGGTGFIGLHLVMRLLKEGRKVRLLCRSGSEKKLPKNIREAVEIIYGDLKDQKSLIHATQQVSRIFHCAGHVSDWGSESEFFAMNVQGTQWLLEGAYQAQVDRFIHLSSIAAFGTPSPSYFDDETPLGKGQDNYSRTKAEGEKAVFDFYSKTRLPVTVLRPAVVYGWGGAWLEEPIEMIKKNKMFLLGGGQGTCHPCYIENLLDAMLLVATHPNALGKGYIVSDGDSEAMSFQEYFNALAVLIDRKPIRRSIPLSIAKAMAWMFENTARMAHSSKRPLLTQTAIQMVTTQSQMSIGKIQKDLGFVPRYSFTGAMRDLKNLSPQSRLT